MPPFPAPDATPLAMNDKRLGRCGWADGQFDAYVRYHDREWGVPVHDDRRHFEFLVLEGAQAGLSWATVLKRREGYRRAFAGFSAQTVARFDERRIAELLQDPAIVRNEKKIRSAVNNARRFLEVVADFGSFDRYVWSFVGGVPKVNRWRSQDDVPATSVESEALSRDLKSRGFSFVGSTIVYAHMQACGLVNDHTVDCFRHAQLAVRSPTVVVRGGCPA
jgi:DNA-3-methyladenine glycosylase I